MEDSITLPSQQISIKTILSGLAERMSTELAPAEAVEVYGQIKAVQDAIDNMADMARAKLLQYVQEEGVQITETGSLKAQFGNYEVEARIARSGFDPAKVQVLLRHKGMDPESGMDATISYKPNNVKLFGLVDRGNLTRAELELCRYDKAYNLQRPKQVVIDDAE